MMKRYHGIPVSPGVAMGKALVLHSEDFFAVPKSQVGTEDIPREVVRFEEALTKTRADLVRIRKNIANKLGHEHSDIFSAHLLILEDRTLIEKVIVVAHDLAPTETAMMDREHVIAFVTDIGGPTSHTAIMARSLEIPAVVGLDRISQEVTGGDQVIIDGNRGIVIVTPDLTTIDRYTREEERFIELVS